MLGAMKGDLVHQQPIIIMNSTTLVFCCLLQYEPTIEELRHKYEVAMKEKMLVRLEKERLQARTEALEAQVRPLPFLPT